LFDSFDILALPAAQVPPFDVGVRWIENINGERQSDYLDWMRAAYWISATTLPALSLPCGFTANGLPVGLQLVGRPHAELHLLQVANGVEEATGAIGTRPRLPEPHGEHGRSPTSPRHKSKGPDFRRPESTQPGDQQLSGRQPS
jgi:amidase